MNQNNSKSLGAVRQKLRKYICKEFEVDVAKFRENPDTDDYETADKEKDGSDADDDEVYLQIPRTFRVQSVQAVEEGRRRQC